MGRAAAKLRHIATQCLWVQQRVRDGTFELRKIFGIENPADLFTKHLTSQEYVVDLLNKMGCKCIGGRAAAAPTLRAASGTSKGEQLVGCTEGAEGDATAGVPVSLPRARVRASATATPGGALNEEPVKWEELLQS